MSIEEWLKSGRNYKQGCELLSSLRKSKSLLKHLQRKEDPVRLAYELCKLAGVDVNTAYKASISAPDKLIIPTGFCRRIPFADMPENGKQLILKKGRLNRNRALLHKEYLIPGEENNPESMAKRAELKTKIEAITIEIETLQKQINTIEEGLVTPGPKTKKEDKAGDDSQGDKLVEDDKDDSSEENKPEPTEAEIVLGKAKRLKNLISSLSKDRKKLGEPDCKNKDKVAERIVKKETEIAELRKELDGKA